MPFWESYLTAPLATGALQAWPLPPGRGSYAGPDGGVSGSDFSTLSLHLYCDPAQLAGMTGANKTVPIPELAKLYPEFLGQAI